MVRGYDGEVLINPIISVIPIDADGNHESWFWWVMAGKLEVA